MYLLVGPIRDCRLHTHKGGLVQMWTILTEI